MKLKPKRDAAAPDAPREACARALAEIAVESWRLDRAVEHAMARMDPMEAERFAGQYRWFQRRVDAALAGADMRLVDLTGQPYSVGMAATPLNLDEFRGGELEVVQTVEPVVMRGGEVMRTGTLLLGPRRAPVARDTSSGGESL